MEFLKSSSRVTECVFAAMTDAAAIDVMEALGSCRCCLRRAPDKGLHTPHTHEGSTEIYSHMIKECFNINLPEGGDTSPGICEVCVGRLRDASAFKAQVQSSQKELKARMEKAFQTVDEEPMVKPEIPDDDEMRDILHEEVHVKTEGEDKPSDEPMLYAELKVKPEVSDDSASEADSISLSSVCASTASAAAKSTRLREPLALACSVKLERLRSDEAPHASQTSLATSHHEPRRASCIEEEPNRKDEQVNTHSACRTQFTKKSKLISHIDDNITHTQTHKDKTAFCCDLCSVQFTSKSYLIHHIGTHEHRRVLHTCAVCNQTFINCILLNKHLRCHSIVKLETTCRECHKRFPSKSEIKPYRCKTCNHPFTQKGHLLLHERIHIGVNLYKCEECNKRFASRTHLSYHKSTHSGVKPFKCKECNKQFILKSSLHIHERTHSGLKPYKCEKCNKQFALKRSLINHERTHSGVKRHMCEKCNEQFARKRTLHVHERTHSRVRPYKCQECNEKFIHKSNLYKHVCNKHGNQDDNIEFTQKVNIVTYERRTKKQIFSSTEEQIKLLN